MYTIRHSDAGWELLDGDGNVVGEAHANYAAAIGALSSLLGDLAELAAVDDDHDGRADGVPEGALPTRWMSGPDGSAQLAATGPSRDFSECVFEFRPGPLALMLKDTASHGGFDDGPARLAGWSDVNELRNGVPYSEGWFHDNDAGREALRIVKAQGQFGVSLDPGEAVDAEFECTEFDDDGWCLSEVVHFTAYEIAGQTLTPFPGFQDAFIVLVDDAAGDDDEPADDDDDAMAAGGAARARVASGAHPTVDPRPEYLTAVPPALSDSRWVVQPATGLPALPLDISDPDEDGWRHVSGMAAAAGVCHIAYADECVTYPPSPTDYANFHLFATRTADGVDHMTGNLVYGRDHAPLSGLDLRAARDNYAHTGLRWASVRATDFYAPADAEGVDFDGNPIAGQLLGCWITGVVAPEVTPAAVRVLRAGGLSGDWREAQGFDALDMVGCQSVNVPGFPISRVALAAAGLELAPAHMRVRKESGRVVAATGIGIVVRAEETMDAFAAAGTVRCGTCPEPEALAAPGMPVSHTGRLSRRPAARRPAAVAPDPALVALLEAFDRVQADLAKVEARTRHLIPAEVAARRPEMLAAAGAVVSDG